MKWIKYNEPVPAKRRVYFDLRGVDGITPINSEANNQPQINSDGAGWTNTGIGTLVSMGFGRYYADLTQAAVAVPGVQIETRYLGATTAETPGDSVIVVGFDPYTTAFVTPSPPNFTTGYMTVYDLNGAPLAGVSVSATVTDARTDMGNAYIGTTRTAVSDANGLVQFPNMFKGVTYGLMRGAGPKVFQVDVPLAVGPTFELPSIIGT